MQAVEEEKKKVEDNGNDCNHYDIVSLQQLFNLQQQYIDLYDVRSAKEYELNHIQDATNIADPMKFTRFSEEYDLPIVIYGDSNIMTKDLCDYLFQIAKSQNKEQRFAVFNRDYAEFYAKYKFLCECNKDKLDNDDEEIIYPAMIIYDGLYLGDMYMAENKDVMINLNVTHIVNVTKCHSRLDKNIKNKIKYLQIGIEDSSLESISSYFDKANDFIEQALNENDKNVVFVHCMAGQSRSPSIIIAYLMKSKQYSLIDAYLHTKLCRPKVSPNTGFYDELIQHETKLFNKSTKNELEQALKLKKWAFNYFSGTWDMS